MAHGKFQKHARKKLNKQKNRTADLKFIKPTVFLFAKNFYLASTTKFMFTNEGRAAAKTESFSEPMT